MQLVIDSNIYIFAFGPFEDKSSLKLLNALVEKHPANTLRILRLTVNEVKRHLTPEAFREFIEFITSLTTIDEDFLVPFEIGAKYEKQGLKPADAFIAAYVEWTGADILVTENRHFLSRHSSLPFKVLTAEQTLKVI